MRISGTCVFIFFNKGVFQGIWVFENIYIYIIHTHMGSFWCFEGISIADSEDGRLESLDKVQMSRGSHGSQWGRCDMVDTWEKLQISKVVAPGTGPERLEGPNNTHIISYPFTS